MTNPERLPDKATNRRAATLIELLASMAILSVLILVLGTMLDSALGRFRGGTESARQRGGARAAAEWIERDLASHLSSRPANLPRLPDGTTEAQRDFFEGRLLLPFEIHRKSGTDGTRSFANAAPEFGSLAFAALLPDPGGGSIPAIVGYYVTYTRDSPFAGDTRAGMKLFRHCRRCGHPTAEGYADGLLRHASLAINDAFDGTIRPLGEPNPAALRQGRFENAALPFLLAHRLDPAPGATPRSAAQPWPALPVMDRLPSPPPSLQPPRGSVADWENPASPVHESVFPDETICDHVVRFELTPYRRVVLPDGNSILMGAAELNQHLGLDGGDEWPALVAPDLIEIVIAVVPGETALRLTRYEDWIVDWARADAGDAPPGLRQLVEASRTHRFRIALPTRSA